MTLGVVETMEQRRLIMSEKIDLKELERKAFRSTFQDGLWDIFLGLLLLNMAIGTALGGVLGEAELSLASLLRVLLIIVPLPFLILAGFWAGKKFITTPRVGSVRFGPRRNARTRNVRAVLFVSVLLSVITVVWGLVAMGHGLPHWMSGIPLPLFIWPVQTIVVFGLAAYFLDIPRFYLYGVLYGLPLLLGVALAENTDLSGLVSMAITYSVPVGIMVLTGVVLFIRFLRAYPKPDRAGLERDGGL
jgi:hypothetical protein